MSLTYMFLYVLKRIANDKTSSEKRWIVLHLFVLLENKESILEECNFESTMLIVKNRKRVC